MNAAVALAAGSELEARLTHRAICPDKGGQGVPCAKRGGDGHLRIHRG